MKCCFRKIAARFRIEVALLLLLLLLLLGVGSLVFVSSRWCTVFDMPENQRGVGSISKHSSEALAVTHYNIISEKLSARAHGENWITSAGQRRSLLRKRTPPGARPPPPVPRRKTPSPPPS